MRHEDPLADNLLARLFSYSPRKDREPLEDFCTEVLAWCIRAHPQVAERLFEISGPIQVITQHRVGSAGRLDLLVFGTKPIIGTRCSVIIESKRIKPPAVTQLSRYRSHAERHPEQFPDVRIWSLAGMSFSDEQVAESLTWTVVAEELDDLAGRYEGPLIADNKRGAHRTAFRWFAQFLREKGMAMEFPEFDLSKASAAADQFEFYKWIFQQLHEMSKPIWLKSHLGWKKAETPCLVQVGHIRYLGMETSNSPEAPVCWIGFFWDYSPDVAARDQTRFGIAAELRFEKSLKLETEQLMQRVEHELHHAEYRLVNEIGGAKGEQRWVTIGRSLLVAEQPKRRIGSDFEELVRFATELNRLVSKPTRLQS